MAEWGYLTIKMIQHDDRDRYREKYPRNFASQSIWRDFDK